MEGNTIVDGRRFGFHVRPGHAAKGRRTQARTSSMSVGTSPWPLSRVGCGLAAVSRRSSASSVPLAVPFAVTGSCVVRMSMTTSPPVPCAASALPSARDGG